MTHRIKFGSAAFFPVLLVSAFLFGLGGSVPHTFGQGTACAFSESQVAAFYNAVFHRELDEGALGYVGRDFDFVVNELMSSEEHTQYTKVYSAVKDFENGIRSAPGGVVIDTDRTQYLAEIDSAVEEIRVWAETLPPLEETPGIESLGAFADPAPETLSVFSFRIASPCILSQPQVEKLYNAVFHRELDSGALGYVGRDFDFVVNELVSSEEHTQYSKLFASVKSLENAVRPVTGVAIQQMGTPEAEIDLAVSEIEDWAKTLPQM